MANGVGVGPAGDGSTWGPIWTGVRVGAGGGTVGLGGTGVGGTAVGSAVGVAGALHAPASRTTASATPSQRPVETRFLRENGFLPSNKTAGNVLIGSVLAQR
jgi:hypothetical protein